MSQRVKAGGIATFVCIATGDPTPHITWRKDKKPIPQRYEMKYWTDRPLTNLLIGFRYQVLDFPGGSLLRIEPVRRKPEQSQIECLAENGAGDPVYSKATLVVYDGKF